MSNRNHHHSGDFSTKRCGMVPVNGLKIPAVPVDVELDRGS